MRRAYADLILLGCAAIWGFAFILQKSAMAHVGPFLFITLRTSVAILALVPLLVLEARPATAAPRRLWLLGFVAGLAFFAGAALQQMGLITATVTNTGFLTALYVVLVPFMVWGIAKRRPAALVWLAAAVSFAGTWLLGGGSLGAFSRGDLLIAACAIFWALHVVVLSMASPFGRPVLVMVVQFATVTMLAGVSTLLSEPVSFDAIAAITGEVAYLGVLSSALTFTLLTWAMRWTPPSEASIIVSTETLIAAASAYLLLGERLEPIGWAGAGMILGAILLVQLAPVPEKPGAARAEPVTTRS